MSYENVPKKKQTLFAVILPSYYDAYNAYTIHTYTIVFFECIYPCVRAIRGYYRSEQERWARILTGTFSGHGFFQIYMT